MESSFDSLIKILEQLYSQQIPMANELSKGIEPLVRVFAAIGALVYIFGRVIVQIANSQDIDFFPLLRPFVLLLLIPFAPNLCDAMDGLGKEIRGRVNTGNLEIAARVEAMNERIQKKVDQKWAEIRSDPAKYKEAFGTDQEKDKIAGFEFMIDFRVFLAKASENFKFQLLSYTQDILLALMYIADSALLLISVAYRIVLRMGFPIALVLAIFPGFTLALANWFGSYLNFVLLPAVAAMYSRITFGLVETYLASYDAKGAVSAMGSETAQPEFLGIAFIALLVMSLIGYIQVPSMTSMLVSVGGVGSIVQGATRTSKQVGGLAARGGAAGARATGSGAIGMRNALGRAIGGNSGKYGR